VRPAVAAGPYAHLAHPWCLGCLVALLGLRLHPDFGPSNAFKPTFWALSALHVALLVAEVADLHVPTDMRFLASYADFAK
jgi:protein-S-isoprenylcysteine O-methyltransferase Ste14